jgi:archaemetzincin
MEINIVPVHISNTELLNNIIRELKKTFASPINLLQLKIDVDPAYSMERAQYFSTKLIATASQLTDGINGKVLLLTEFDIYIPALTFVFGEAQLNGTHSIVSVCRLHEEFYLGKTDENLLLKRSMKEVLHELGHSFGLFHCHDWECVMHSSLGIEEVDIKGSDYCKNCKEQISSSKLF